MIGAMLTSGKDNLDYKLGLDEQKRIRVIQGNNFVANINKIILKLVAQWLVPSTERHI